MCVLSQNVKDNSLSISVLGLLQFSSRYFTILFDCDTGIAIAFPARVHFYLGSCCISSEEAASSSMVVKVVESGLQYIRWMSIIRHKQCIFATIDLWHKVYYASCEIEIIWQTSWDDP